jgi:hypothetical protein
MTASAGQGGGKDQRRGELGGDQQDGGRDLAVLDALGQPGQNQIDHAEGQKLQD